MLNRGEQERPGTAVGGRCLCGGSLVPRPKSWAGPGKEANVGEVGYCVVGGVLFSGRMCGAAAADRLCPPPPIPPEVSESDPVATVKRRTPTGQHGAVHWEVTGEQCMHGLLGGTEIVGVGVHRLWGEGEGVTARSMLCEERCARCMCVLSSPGTCSEHPCIVVSG